MDRATNGFRATMRDRILGVAAIGSSLIGAVSQAGINQLTPIGPEGGRTFEVEFNRNSPDLIYVTTPAGFHRSTDGGASWQLTQPLVQEPLERGDIAVDPNDSNHVYVANAHNGIFISEDGGLTFTDASIPGGRKRHVMTGSDGVVYAPDETGMYRSDDRGHTWVRAGSFPQSGADLNSNFAVDPSDARVVYASLFNQGLFVSRDAGASRRSLRLDGARRDRSARSDDRVCEPVFVGTGLADHQWWRNGLWLSADSGAHWTQGSAGLSGATIQGIVPMPAAAGYYVSTVNGIHALDSNNTFRALNNDALANMAGLLRSPSVFDVVAITNGATDTLIAYLDYAQRLVRSVDGGAQWTMLPLPGATQWMRSPVLSPGAQPTLYVATQVGVFSSTDLGDTWTSRSVGLPPIVNQVITTSDPQVLYAEARPNNSTPTSLYRSNDGAQSWTVTTFPSSTSVTAAEADANTANNSASGQVNVTTAPPTNSGGGGGGGGGGGAMSPLFLLALVALLCLHEVRGRILFALIATVGFTVTASAAEAPTIERTGDWRVNVREFAEANLKHPAWGASHSTRDYELAKELAAADKVTLDDDVLYAASYLHDVAAFAPFAKPGVDHQDQAASVVESLLEGTGFPMAKIEAVRGAIRTHMFGRDPVGPEAIYLHDADALDWLGAIGVARIIGLVDPNGGNPDGPTVMKRLESNLANVPSRIVSKAGKVRTPERVRELEEFLRSLRKETADFKTL